MQQYDFLQRIIEQLGAALARIAGCRARGDLDQALAEVRAGLDGLDVNPHLLTGLDTESVARLLRRPEKVRAVARLLAEEATLLAALGRREAAATQGRRALGLYRTLDALPPDGDDATIVAALERSV